MSTKCTGKHRAQPRFSLRQIVAQTWGIMSALALAGGYLVHVTVIRPFI
jgi:hypothetical protein